MIINSDVDPKAPFLAERSFLRVYLEAFEGFQCRPKIFRSTETPQPRCVLRNRVKPELISIHEPNVRIPKQTTSDCSRIDSQGQNRRLLRDEFRGGELGAVSSCSSMWLRLT